MAINKEIIVFAEKPTLVGELIAAARFLAGPLDARVNAVLVGSQEQAEQAVARGADEVFWLDEMPLPMLVEDLSPWLAEFLQQRESTALLCGATVRGKTVAGRVAARLDSEVITDVKEFSFANGELLAKRMIFGGGALRIEKPRSWPFLTTVAGGTFSALEPDPTRSGRLNRIEFSPPDPRVVVRARKPRAAATVNLAAARKVVCPGRGLARKEDLGLVEELARALGAEIGCTRPLAEGLDWLPRERYIGISGATIKADLYIGLGVSGQVQHTVGMSGTRVVVAVNKDREAPVFTQSDYGYVGDLYDFVPALIEALKNR